MCLFVAIEPTNKVNLLVIVLISLGIPMILLAVLLLVRYQRYCFCLWLNDSTVDWRVTHTLSYSPIHLHNSSQTCCPLSHVLYFSVCLCEMMENLNLKKHKHCPLAQRLVLTSAEVLKFSEKTECWKEMWEECLGGGSVFFYKKKHRINPKLP